MSYWDNSTLENYFEDEVPVSRVQSNAVLDSVLPKIKQLLEYVSYRDGHFEAEPVAVGSYTQGLGVDGNRDYDFSVVFHYDWSKRSSRLTYSPKSRSSLNYDFENQEHRSIFDQKAKICYVPYSLSSPGPGYSFVTLDMNIPGYTFSGDLIPFYVQRNFGFLLKYAIDALNSSKSNTARLHLSDKFHGPALKIETKVRTEDGQIHPVSVDLAVIIRAELPFLPEMGWPVPYAKWPSVEKIQAIKEKGINLVAKKELWWQLSFAELEKLLVKEIDKDGGCRKIVHRIMKSVFYYVCTEKSVLSTYILKNIWFHECGKYPHSFQWSNDQLMVRYAGCVQSLINCSRNGVLWQYFDRRVNLLKGKNIIRDAEKIRCFDFTPWIN